MSDQVDEIKAKNDIVSIIGERVELKKAGRNFKGLCPFHSEKTPSFMVSPELQMFKCFGCGEAGDVIAFLEKFEGMEFREALKFLADRVGIKLISFRPGEEGEKDRLYQITSLAARFYNYVLLNHRLGRPALDYFTKERGISLDTIKTFQLGFSPEIPGAISKFLVDKKKFNTRDLEKAGLVVSSGGRFFDRFKGRVIFPLFDHRGNISGFAGRVLPWQKGDLAKYINSPETPIYHKGNLLFGLSLTKEEIKKSGAAVVVEGELDMIASWQAGVKNTVAIKGSALTEDQVRLLSRFTKRLTLALDADFAGDTAARRGIGVAQGLGLEIKVARLEPYKDPDEAARKNPEEFKKILSEGVGVWDFIIDSVFSKADSGTGEGKRVISSEIVPVLGSIPDKIVQAHYIALVAKKLNVPVESVSQEVLRNSSQEIAKTEVVKIEKIPEKGRRQLLEERLLTLAFAGSPEILSQEWTSKLVSTPLAKRILEEYVKFPGRGKSFSASLFSESLPRELFKGFAEMVLADTENLVGDGKDLEDELDLVKHELEVIDIRHSLELLGVKIRKYEEEGKKSLLRKSQEEFSKLSQKLSNLDREVGAGII